MRHTIEVSARQGLGEKASALNIIKMYRNVAFTGHRYSEIKPDMELLTKVILNLIKGGAKNFYCGMAAGFDMGAAEIVLKFKERYDINLFACIPCDSQGDWLPERTKRR